MGVGAGAVPAGLVIVAATGMVPALFPVMKVRLIGFAAGRLGTPAALTLNEKVAGPWGVMTASTGAPFTTPEKSYCPWTSWKEPPGIVIDAVPYWFRSWTVTLSVSGFVLPPAPRV